MKFSVNDLFIYLVVAAALLIIMAQSIAFLVRAVRRAKELGLGDKVKSTVFSSAVFSVAPAVSILLGVVVLSKFLGLPVPWYRLSILGSLTYEQIAATTAAEAIGVSISDTITDPTVFTTILWVMTLGIIPGIFIILFGTKKIQAGVLKIKNNNSSWGKILLAALFVGMISAFLGAVFGNVSQGLTGWIPVFVFLCSAVIMMVCAVLLKKLKWNWLENYALPISMISAMALSIPITNAVNAAVGG